jgi:hypothetical protein
LKLASNECTVKLSLKLASKQHKGQKELSTKKQEKEEKNHNHTSLYANKKSANRPHQHFATCTDKKTGKILQPRGRKQKDKKG